MKKLALLALAGCAALPAFAVDIGVTITTGEPGVYGRVDYADAPPAVIYPQPMVVNPQPYSPQPIYMYVPLEHQRNWSFYCARYNACSAPVYFVREDWVRDRWDRQHARGWRHDEDRRWQRDGDNRHERRDWDNRQERRDWDNRHERRDWDDRNDRRDWDGPRR